MRKLQSMRSLNKDNTTLQFNNNITPLMMRVVKLDGLGNEGGKVSVCNSRGQSHPTGSHNKLTCETLVKWMASVIHDIIQLIGQYRTVCTIMGQCSTICIF